MVHSLYLAFCIVLPLAYGSLGGCLVLRNFIIIPNVIIIVIANKETLVAALFTRSQPISVVLAGKVLHFKAQSKGCWLSASKYGGRHPSSKKNMHITGSFLLLSRVFTACMQCIVIMITPTTEQMLINVQPSVQKSSVSVINTVNVYTLSILTTVMSILSAEL